MKNLKQYITEKMVYTKANTNTNVVKYKYHPQTNNELRKIVEKLVDEQSMEDVINLNSIDISEITDMSRLFDGMEGLLKIDVSGWDVSNVKYMDSMFKGCVNLEKIVGIEDWDVSNVESTRSMFYNCEAFNQDISNWVLNNDTFTKQMFENCPIEEKYKPKFK